VSLDKEYLSIIMAMSPYNKKVIQLVITEI
jgi:hypothetical protein